MKLYRIILPILIFILPLGCAQNNFGKGSNSFYSPRSYEPPNKEAYTNFYERHLGETIFTDILSGFTPTAIIGAIGDTIHRHNLKEKEKTKAPSE